MKPLWTRNWQEIAPYTKGIPRVYKIQAIFSAHLSERETFSKKQHKREAIMKHHFSFAFINIAILFAHVEKK